MQIILPRKEASRLPSTLCSLLASSQSRSIAKKARTTNIYQRSAVYDGTCINVGLHVVTIVPHVSSTGDVTDFLSQQQTLLLVLVSRSCSGTRHKISESD